MASLTLMSVARPVRRANVTASSQPAPRAQLQQREQPRQAQSIGVVQRVKGAVLASVLVPLVLSAAPAFAIHVDEARFPNFAVAKRRTVHTKGGTYRLPAPGAVLSWQLLLLFPKKGVQEGVHKHVHGDGEGAKGRLLVRTSSAWCRCPLRVPAGVTFVAGILSHSLSLPLQRDGLRRQLRPRRGNVRARVLGMGYGTERQFVFFS